MIANWARSARNVELRVFRYTYLKTFMHRNIDISKTQTAGLSTLAPRNALVSRFQKQSRHEVIQDALHFPWY